ncbi:MAG TPA: hypothetical protein VJB99_01895 [Patescibacteria group bacterium]|nr:hypothetical protein [Patescibacteria group bacterium]
MSLATLRYYRSTVAYVPVRLRRRVRQFIRIFFLSISRRKTKQLVRKFFSRPLLCEI